MTSLKLIHNLEVRRLAPIPQSLAELTDKARNLYGFQFSFYFAFEQSPETKVPIRTEAEFSAHLSSLKPGQVCRLFLCEIEEDQPRSRPAETVEEIKSERFIETKEHEKSVLDNPNLDPQSEVYVKGKTDHCITDLSTIGARLEVSDDEDESNSSVESSSSDSSEALDDVADAVAGSKFTKKRDLSALLEKINSSRLLETSSIQKPPPANLIDQTPRVPSKDTAETLSSPETRETLEKASNSDCAAQIEIGCGTTVETTESSSNTHLTEFSEQSVGTAAVDLHHKGINCATELVDFGSDAIFSVHADAETHAVQTTESSSNTLSLEFSEQAVETAPFELHHKGISCTTELVDSGSDAIHAIQADAETHPIETTEFYTNTSREFPIQTDAFVEAIQPSKDQSTDAWGGEFRESSSNTPQVEMHEKAIDRRSVETHEISVCNQVETAEICLGTQIETCETSSSAFYPESFDQISGETAELMEFGCDARIIEEASTETQLIETFHAATDPHPIDKADNWVSAIADNSEVSTETDMQVKAEAEVMTEHPVPDLHDIYEQILGDFRSSLRLEFSALRKSLRKTKTVTHSAACMKCNADPIHGPRYVCVECHEISLCSACEESSNHPHTLLKLRNEDHLRYFQELLMPEVPEKQSLINSMAASSCSDELSDKVERIRRMGFDDVAKIMSLLVMNRYNVDLTVDALVSEI